MAAKRPSIGEAVNADFQARSIGVKPQASATNTKLTEVTIALRISKADSENLKAILADQGLTVSSGIRMMIREYLKKHMREQWQKTM